MKLTNSDLVIFVDRKFFVNTYLLVKDNKCIAIDPGFNEVKINDYLTKHSLKMVGIILTHGHYDHIGNGFVLAKQLHIKVYAHSEEKSIVETNHLASELGCVPNIDASLIEYFSGKTLTIDIFSFDILLLKGHTPGGTCLKYHNYVFSGDVIFYDSVGRTDLVLGNANDMKQSINKFKQYYNDDDLILPGHGPNGFLKDIKLTNPFFK
jgi:glyoxylase-like metal-dependent hydrolase (beta-lactamase superfamily II)